MHVKARLRHKIEWLACIVQLMFCDQLVAGNGIPNSTNAYMLHKQIKRQIDVLSSLPLLPFHLTLMVFAIAKCRHSVVNPRDPKGSVAMLVWGSCSLQRPLFQQASHNHSASPNLDWC